MNNIKNGILEIVNEARIFSEIIVSDQYYSTSDYTEFRNDSLNLFNQLDNFVKTSKYVNSVSYFRPKNSFIKQSFKDRKSTDQYLTKVNDRYSGFIMSNNDFQDLYFRILNLIIKRPFLYIVKSSAETGFENKLFFVTPKYSKADELISIAVTGLELEDYLISQGYLYNVKNLLSVRISNKQGLIVASTDRIYNNDDITEISGNQDAGKDQVQNAVFTQDGFYFLYSRIEIKNSTERLQIQLRFRDKGYYLPSYSELMLIVTDPVNFGFIILLIALIIFLSIRIDILKTFSAMESVFLKMAESSNLKSAFNKAKDIYQFRKKYHFVLVRIIDKINYTENTLHNLFSTTQKPDSKDLYYSDTICQLKEEYLKIQKIYNNLLIEKISSEEEKIIPKGLLDLKEKMKNTININNYHMWQNDAISKLHNVLSGIEIDSLSNKICAFFAELIEAQILALYIFDDFNDKLILSGSYGFEVRPSLRNEIIIGEGLAGQAAFEKKTISVANVENYYRYIQTYYITTKPTNLTIVPILKDDKVLGLLEIASLIRPEKHKVEFLKMATTSISSALQTALDHKRINNLLKISQEKSLELENQKEALLKTNVELEEQTRKLKESEEELKIQQDRLQVANQELEEKTEYLQVQQKEIKEKNIILTQAKIEVEKKADELEKSNKYKSDFLANVSHELRTPLNSLLLLARSLYKNKENNLNQEQKEDINIIYKNGQDLLNLINDVLDFSKIESGKMDVYYEDIDITELKEKLYNSFKPLIEQKHLNFKLSVSSNFPSKIHLDQMKLEQIIRNLLSNAIKFTAKGEIHLAFTYHQNQAELTTRYPDLSSEQLNDLKDFPLYSITVSDTGIGISPEKQQLIFDAFKQADGSTSRNYGGTGLGLSISKQLAELQGGSITVTSKAEAGSVFYVFLPVLEKTEEAKLEYIDEKLDDIANDQSSFYASNLVYLYETNTRLIELIIEHGNKKNLEVVPLKKAEDLIANTLRNKPKAVIIDLLSPDQSGWKLLQLLKANPLTREIPVHTFSVDNDMLQKMNTNEFSLLTKPVEINDLERALNYQESFSGKEIKKILLVEDNAELNRELSLLLEEKFENMQIFSAEMGHEALEILKADNIDCLILDIKLPDFSGIDLLKKLEENSSIELPKVIVYTGKKLSKEEQFELQKYTGSVILKTMRSKQNLITEAEGFFDTISSEQTKDIKNISTTESKESLQTAIPDLNQVELEKLKGKKILLVDDDMRNLYALSKALADYEFNITKVPGGQKALEILDKANCDIDIILLDLMMPGMDGFETLKRIKELKNNAPSIPVIILTAKSAEENKDHCLKLGAKDFVTKPVNISELVSHLIKLV